MKNNLAMRNNLAGYLKRGAAPLAMSIALLASPAFAQDTDKPAAAEDEEILVTGSRIPQPNLEATARSPSSAPRTRS